MLSTQLQAGFWCREWGLFAQDPVAGEILYMITIDNQPEWLPASTAAAQVSATYAMNIAVANATNIEVQIDPAGLVDVEMLQSYMGLAKRSTAVALGDTAMLENLPVMYFLECTTAGTSGATAPVITPPVAEGNTITDGTVVWTVRKCIITKDLNARLGNIFHYELYGQLQNGTKSYPLVSNRLYLVVCAHPLASTNGLYLVTEGKTSEISKFASNNVSPTITISDGVLTITIGNRAVDYTVYCVGVAN